MFGLKKVNLTIKNLDRFLDCLGECVPTYKNGIKNYLEGNDQDFADNLTAMAMLRTGTAELRHAIETDLYTNTHIADSRVDTLRLLEVLDKMAGLLHKNLCQYEIEVPFFPAELGADFLKLVEIAARSVECASQASKDFFRTPQVVAEKTQRIYYLDKEAGKLAQSIKRRVFHDMDNLKLSQKIHLRYFTLHVEELAEEAVKAADQLSIMLIKQNH